MCEPNNYDDHGAAEDAQMAELAALQKRAETAERERDRQVSRYTRELERGTEVFARLADAERERGEARHERDLFQREANLVREALKHELNRRVPVPEQDERWNAGYRARQVEEWSIGSYRRKADTLEARCRALEGALRKARAIADKSIDWWERSMFSDGTWIPHESKVRELRAELDATAKPGEADDV